MGKNAFGRKQWFPSLFSFSRPAYRMARINEARTSVPPPSPPTCGAPASQVDAITEALQAVRSHAASMSNQLTINERPLLQEPSGNDDSTAGQRLPNHPAEGTTDEIFPDTGDSAADRQISEDGDDIYNTGPDTYTAFHQTPNDEDRGGCMDEGGGLEDGDNVSDTDALEMGQDDCGGLTDTHQRKQINESGGLVLVSRQAPTGGDRGGHMGGGGARGGLVEQMDEGSDPDNEDEWNGFTGDEEHTEMGGDGADVRMDVAGNECGKGLEKSVEEGDMEDLGMAGMEELTEREFLNNTETGGSTKQKHSKPTKRFLRPLRENIAKATAAARQMRMPSTSTPSAPSTVQHTDRPNDDLAKLISDAVGEAMREVLAHLPRTHTAHKPRTRGHAYDDGMEADIEDGEDDYRPKPRKIKGRPKRRPGAKNEFLRMIREHGLLLTHRDTSDSDFYDVPTPEEVAAYDPIQGPCCTAERFRMDIRGFPKSAWNVSAAKVFARSFQEAHAQFRDKAQREVERAWTTHLAYLKNVYQKQTSKARDIEADKQRHRRKERRTQMYYRRMGVAESCRYLRNDGLAIVKELGIDGMSSDESDHPPGNGIPVYQVRIKQWRSCKVTEILRACDALHLRMRYGGDWDASPGAWPHLRIPSLKYSTRAATPQLPSNFYNLNWFKSLNEFQRDALQPRIEEYSLEVPEQIIREVKRYDLSIYAIVSGKARTTSADDE